MTNAELDLIIPNLAYHGSEDIKAKLLASLAKHREADKIVKGQYWENGKGCAIGCMVHSGDYNKVVQKFGWSLPITKLVDTIFEGLPNDQAQLWPERIVRAHRAGADTSLVHWRFLHWLLTDKVVNPGIDHPLVRDAVRQCADVLAPMTKGSQANKDAAWSAACSAWSAADSAESAWSAKSAAWAAWSAADSAESAVWAAWAADSAAESAADSAAGARSAAFVLMADKLVELVEAASPPPMTDWSTCEHEWTDAKGDFNQMDGATEVICKKCGCPGQRRQHEGAPDDQR